MELETVGGVSVGDLGLEVGGQVDDVDGVEGAFLGADTTSYAQALGDEGDFGLIGDFDAQFAGTDDGAGFFAFLSTFLGSCQPRDSTLCDLRDMKRRGLLTFGLHCCGTKTRD